MSGTIKKKNRKIKKKWQNISVMDIGRTGGEGIHAEGHDCPSSGADP